MAQEKYRKTEKRPQKSPVKKNLSSEEKRRREEEKKEIEKQLAIEKRKNRAFSYPQILAYLDYMRTIGRKNPAQRSILINTFVHSVYLYDDHFTIIFNGGKGQISAENIPFKKIEKSLKSGKVGINLCSTVVTSVPPFQTTI